MVRINFYKASERGVSQHTSVKTYNLQKSLETGLLKTALANYVRVNDTLFISTKFVGEFATVTPVYCD